MCVFVNADYITIPLMCHLMIEIFIFLISKVWILEGARCCSNHLIHCQLTTDAINQIKPLSTRQQELNSSDVQLLLSKVQMLLKNRNKRFNFDDTRDLTDDQFRLLTRLSRNWFWWPSKYCNIIFYSQFSQSIDTNSHWDLFMRTSSWIIESSASVYVSVTG